MNDGTQVTASSSNGALKRPAFTLVELLVVITIIGILIALLVPAVSSALTSAKNAQIGVEIASLTNAMKGYKAKALSFPPDFAGDDNHDINVALKAHFARIARNRKPNDVPAQQMTPAQLDAMYGVAGLYPDNQPSAIGLDPSEALVFWLSGFSDSPTHPVTGPGDRKPLFEFDKSRLRDADGDGFPEYYPKNGEQPYVYLQKDNYALLDASNGGTPAQISTGVVLQPYHRESTSSTPEYAEAEGFQIICAGLDNEFGAQGGVYHNGLGYVRADQDNITNFSEGKTLKDATP